MLISYTKAGYMLDTFVVAMAVYGIIHSWSSISDRRSANKVLVLLCTICPVFLAANIVSSSSASSLAFMLTELSLSACSLLTSKSLSKLQTWLVALLHVLYSARLAFFDSPLSTATMLTGTLLHLCSAWFTLDIKTRMEINSHLYQLFSFDGFKLMKNMTGRMLEDKDMVCSIDKSEFQQKIEPSDTDLSKRFSLWRFTLSEEWVSMIGLIAGRSLINIMNHGRQLVYFAIISILETSDTSTPKRIAILFAIWQGLTITDVFSRYLSKHDNLLMTKLRLRLSAKLIHSEIFKKVQKPCDNDSIVYVAWGVAGGPIVFIEFASNLISQIFNLWIMANRVGIYFLVPLLTIGAYCLLDITIKYRANKSIKRKGVSKTSRFYEKYRNIISNLRPIKFYAWDNLFAKNIKTADKLQEKESFFWRSLAFLVSFIGSAMSMISMTITIYIYTYMTGAGIAYSDVILLTDSADQIKSFTNWLSSNYDDITDNIDDYKAALKILEPDNNTYVNHNLEPTSDNIAIGLDNAMFSWGDDKFALKPISLQINAGEFVTIIGRIGSGKTSLLEAIAAEMPIIHGQGDVYGKLAYVTQKPYIMNATFRENVLMASEYNEDLFNQVVKACVLDEDVKQFPAGDLTEIGQNGINLSGGQKVRLAIARALYSQADIYLFDDILSAVDANVERQLVENILSSDGIIGNKTRVLVTHADHVVPLCNKVITLVDSQVSIKTQEPIKIITDNMFAQQIIKPDNSSNDSATNSSKLEEETFDEKSGQYIINPEEGNTGFKFKHLFWFINHSGHLTVASLVIIKLLSICFVYYVESMRFDIMRSFNQNTTLDQLKKYLVISAIAKIADDQIENFEEWAIKKFWTKKVSKKLVNVFVRSVLRMKLPLAERLSESRLRDVLRDLELSIPRIFPKIMYSGIFSSFIGIIVPIVHLSKISIWLLVTVGLFILICIYSEVSLSRFYSTLHKISRDYFVDSSNKNVQVLSTGSKYVRTHKIYDRYMEKLNNDSFMIYALKYIEGSADAYVHNARYIFMELINGIVLGLNIKATINSGNTSTILGSVDAIKSSLYKVQKNIISVNFGIESFKRLSNNLATAYIYCEDLDYEAPAVIEDSQPKSNWPSEGTIEFIDYSMRYRPELDIVLDGLSFSVRKHEKIGIVGRTGAGKSSITYALMRLVEAESGCIKIDGVDISSIGLYDLRSKITIIPQDPVLFEGTIRDNLDPEQKYTDEEVWDAINTCQINELVDNPGCEKNNNKKDKSRAKGTGLDKWIKPGSETFSVGQAQLVSLCRALLWKSKIIVLDEATANVDSKTDKIIQEVIRERFTDCTVLTIAHRLNTIMDSDRILVLDHGHVKEFDSPSNLLADRNSQFSRLVESMKLSQATLNK